MKLTQTDRVIRFLRDNPGCTTMELTLALSPFVANPRARISDARAEGFVIECRTRSSDHRKWYWLVEAGQRTLGLAG